MHYASIEAMPKGSGQTIDIEKDGSYKPIKLAGTVAGFMSKWLKWVAIAVTIVVFIGAVLGYLWDVFRYDPVEPVRPAVKSALADAAAKKSGKALPAPEAARAPAPEMVSNTYFVPKGETWSREFVIANIVSIDAPFAKEARLDGNDADLRKYSPGPVSLPFGPPQGGLKYKTVQFRSFEGDFSVTVKEPAGR